MGYAQAINNARHFQAPEGYDPSGVFRDSAQQWLYTAITRAQKSMTLVMT